MVKLGSPGPIVNAIGQDFHASALVDDILIHFAPAGLYMFNAKAAGEVITRLKLPEAVAPRTTVATTRIRISRYFRIFQANNVWTVGQFGCKKKGRLEPWITAPSSSVMSWIRSGQTAPRRCKHFFLLPVFAKDACL